MASPALSASFEVLGVKVREAFLVSELGDSENLLGLAFKALQFLFSLSGMLAQLPSQLKSYLVLPGSVIFSVSSACNIAYHPPHHCSA